MSSSELAPAERAAAEALLKAATLQGFRLYNLREIFARAVVSAIRPLILREAADLIENSDKLRSFTDDHMGDIEMAADVLRRAASLDGGENHG